MNGKDMDLIALDESGFIDFGNVPKRKPQTFADVGIYNRRDARRAGVRNPQRPRKMAVPRSKK